MTEKEFKELLNAEVPPVKLGNTNKTGECDMCGIKAKKLYPRKVGQVDFMICENCFNLAGENDVFYGYHDEWGYSVVDDVTHWMPLPEPPKVEPS